MKRFESLIQSFTLHKSNSNYADFLKPVESQGQASAHFPALVQQSHLHYWTPGQPIVTSKTRFLVGVATTSLYDMRLLDAVHDAIEQGEGEHIRIDVFNCTDFQDVLEFDKYIPSIGVVFQTPVVGRWENGILVEKSSGASGRRMLTEPFSLTIRFD